MKCPNDQTEMEQGMLGAAGTMWARYATSDLVRKMQKLVSGGIAVFAYKCPKCGKVELTTETK